MPINDALLNVGAAAMGAAATHAQIHTAVPSAGGSNEATSARQPIAWGSASAGDISITAPIEFTGGASSGPALYLGLWSALTGGTFYGYLALVGDQSFNAAGEYTVNDIDLNSQTAP